MAKSIRLDSGNLVSRETKRGNENRWVLSFWLGVILDKSYAGVWRE